MKHLRGWMAAVTISAAAMASTAILDVRLAAACYQCEDGITTLQYSNCWEIADGWRHDQGSQVFFPFWFGGRVMDHENPTAFYCGDCNVHIVCAEEEEEPEDPDDDEEGSVHSWNGFNSEPTKLLAAIEKMDADYFVEQSSGRLVILNCRGGIAHQYKLTADQVAVLSAAEHVAAADE